MEYKFSTVVDSSTFETHGLTENYVVRYHKNAEREDIGCGALGNPIDFLSLVIPECLPERLSIVSSANELAFMRDGNCTPFYPYKPRKASVTGVHCEEMVRIDKDRAIPTIKAWSKFVDYGGRQETTRFKSEKEYIEYRTEDIGLWFWYGLLSFAMALDIPENEREMCHQRCRTAYIQILMLHDFASWEKEKLNAAALGKDVICNIIFVLMGGYGISGDEAKERCCETARKLVADYLKMVEEYKGREDISPGSRKYIEAWLYTISGNAVWSFICPRYNSAATFTDLQLELMKTGVPKDDIPNGSSNGATNGSTNGPTNGAVNGDGHVNSHRPVNGINTGEQLLSAVTVDHLKGRNSFKLGDHDKEVKPIDLHGQALDSKYITALSSKGLREQAINALNVWFRVPVAKLDIIKSITTILHNASLMLDDVEDGSELRLGRPATHKLVRALQQLQKLGDARNLVVFTEELHNLYVGQAMDLYWTSNLMCPSVHEYFQMIEHKTGGLFRLFARLMAIHSTNPVQADLTEFTNSLGRYAPALLADFTNANPVTVHQAKGFCEDFEEGKFSLPTIHLMQTDNLILRNIWTQRRVTGTANHSQKQTILTLTQEAGTLQFTLDSMNVLYKDDEKSVADLESVFGMENFQLRLIMELLKT
ncbi:putative geranylgeranyl diphosphate synthase [Aspergillus californicus]